MTRLAGFLLGCSLALLVFQVGEGLDACCNPFETKGLAMPYGPALLPSVKPVPVLIPSGLQSLSQGEG